MGSELLHIGSRRVDFCYDLNLLRKERADYLSGSSGQKVHDARALSRLLPHLSDACERADARCVWQRSKSVSLDMRRESLDIRRESSLDMRRES